MGVNAHLNGPGQAIIEISRKVNRSGWQFDATDLTLLGDGGGHRGARLDRYWN